MAIRSATGAGARQARSTTSKQAPAQRNWWVVANRPLPAEGLAAQIAGGQTAPAGSKVVSTIPGSAEDNAFFGQRDQPSGGTAWRGLYAIFGPFTSQKDANSALSTPAPGVTTAAGGVVSGWLGSIGGMIAAGIEQGIVSILKDLWAVIEGPVLILLGSLIAVVALGIYFRNNIGATLMTLPK